MNWLAGDREPAHGSSVEIVTTDRSSRWTLLIADAEQRPFAYDWYQLLRRYDGTFPELPRIGEASRPAQERFRLAQEASLTFAPSNVTRVSTTTNGLPRISVRFLGLFGPNGPLPTHLTEMARLRERSHGDATLARFLDMFHHRLLVLFYRAWRSAQPAPSHDRPEASRFRHYLGSLYGAGEPAWFDRDQLGDSPKLHFAGHLSRSARNVDGLESVLGGYFAVPVRVQTFVTDWLDLPEDEYSRLGEPRSAKLGQSAVLGRRIRDAQHQIEIHLGPLTLEQYEGFLPNGRHAGTLADWVMSYTSGELRWRVRLLLRADAVPKVLIGQSGSLGWTSWLGRRPPVDPPAGDLRLAGRTADRSGSNQTALPATFASPPTQHHVSVQSTGAHHV